jgi:ribose transport system ATP-binding protein
VPPSSVTPISSHPGPALEMRGIGKSFAGVRALDAVDLEVAAGEVLGLVGENGAGKSTLMKILSGAYAGDAGQMRVFGEPLHRPSPAEMIARGVAVIYQEMSLAPHLSVAENVFLGRLPRRRLGAIDWARAERETARLTARLGLHIDPRVRVERLSVAQRQMVEIAKALSRDARILVLDEPSAVLGDNELEGLFEVVRNLADHGVALVYISHRLSEVFRLTDRVVVLRDGTLVGTESTPQLDPDRLVSMMVGRQLADIYPERAARIGAPVLQVRGLRRAGVLHDIDLEVGQGEILGVAGLAGAGRTELLRAIVGADPVDEGEIVLGGQAITPRSPRHALRLGIGLLPEDRKSQSLFLHQSVQFNINVAHLGDFVNGGLLSTRAERRQAADYVESLGVRTPALTTPVANLSGGNQQKCVLARLLGARCRVLLVDEPTRGVDVGAKQEIYQLLAELAAHGAAIVMVSSELPELLGLCDRILVMREGRISAQLSRERASEELIMRHATGHIDINETQIASPS